MTLVGLRLVIVDGCELVEEKNREQCSEAAASSSDPTSSSRNPTSPLKLHNHLNEPIAHTD
jgi:hypothetical protein